MTLLVSFTVSINSLYTVVHGENITALLSLDGDRGKAIT
jgi:hypothetical protein